jgi:ribosomal protein S12 methylthiotransferase accessory factor
VEGLGVTMKIVRDEEKRRIGKIAIEIKLPPGFPDRYEKAVVRAADSCSVKKYIINPPEFDTYVTK